MSSKSLGLAVLGCGRWGKNHARTAFELFGDNLKCIADKVDSVRENLPSDELKSLFTTDFDQVFERDDINAIIVATPAETHFKLAERALERGKHVLVEKPMALQSDEAEQLKQLAEDKSLTLMVGHVLLYHPAIQKIKQLLDDGALGQLQYIYSNRLNLGSVRKEENILWSFAPHDISVLRYLTGSDPEAVSAHGAMFLQPGIHDVTVTNLSYPNNVHAHIHVSWLHPFKEHRLVVIGDKSMLVFEDSKKENKLLLYRKGIDWVQGQPVKREEDFEVLEFENAMPLTLEHQDFARCIETRSRPLADATGAIAVLKSLEQAQRSLDSSSRPSAHQTATGSLNSKIAETAFIHPTSIVDENVEIGANTKIWHYSHVQPGSVIGDRCSLGQNVNVGNNVRIGNNCKIQNNVSIYEGVELEDYVFCGPSMVFTNILNPRCEFPQRGSNHYVKTKVRYGASLGANSTIVCGITIRRFAFVGAGAVVTKDVPEFALVVGNPARVVGWMSRDGKKLDFCHGSSCVHGNFRYTLKDGLVTHQKL